jgi:type VI secretion system protein ImpL
MSFDFLSQIGSVWLFVALAVLLIAILVLVFLSGMVRNTAGQGTPPPPPPPNTPPDPKSPPPQSKELASVRGPGWQSAAASFARTMAFLKNTVTGRDYRYQIPWFLVIGEPGAGKSSLLAQTGVNLAPEEGSGEASSNSPLEWRFLDKGILLGVAGNYIAAREGQARDEHGWTRLLRLLQNNRPRRPIDGVVLTIPASDLIGPAAMEEAQLGNRAARIADLLAQAQRTLGFSFPVYVVVTKCDEISGFASFCRELPHRAENEIFGWSSPYNVEATFTTDWVTEAFDHLSNQMRLLQSEIFVQKGDLTHPEDVFLFPEELVKMRTPARVYLDRLFRETAYRESFRFRGIYFTGDITEKPVTELPMVPAVISSRALVPVGAPGSDPGFSSPDAPLSPPPSMDGPGSTYGANGGGWMSEIVPARRSATRYSVKAPVFLKDLFERKIFPEAGLAQPLSKIYLARNRSVLMVQLTAAVLAVIFTVGTVVAYRRLAQERISVIAMLEQMLKMPSTPENERINLLAVMAPAGSVSFRSPFMPTSYFNSVDSDITKVMIFACDQWVLTNMRGGLIERAKTILNQPVTYAAKSKGDAAADDQAPTSVDTTPEYQQLDHFVSDLNALQENADVYDVLRQRGKIEDFEKIRKLLQYLYGRTVQDVQPDGHLAIALHEATGPAFVVSTDDRAHASELMKGMIDHLFEKWFGNSLLLADADTLREKVGQLEQGRSATYPDLKELLDVIKQTEGDFGSPAFRWAGSSTLDLNGPFRRVIYDPIKTRQNPYLTNDVLDYAERQGEEHLRQLRTLLSEERTGMTGPLLDVRDAVVLSAGSHQLQLALENALNLRFMSQTGSRTIRTRFDENTRLIWRLEPLQDAVRLFEIYKRFTDEGLMGTSPRLHDTLNRVALDQLRRNVEDLIAQAQDFQPRNAVNSQLVADDETQPEVTGFRDASGPLLDLAARFKQLGVINISNATLQVMVLQSFNLLAILDRRLNDEDPYAAKGGNFGWWNGKPVLSLAAYDVRNASELQDQLTAQRDRIKFLVQQADPLIQFLNSSFPTRGESQSKLISKWQRLVADFKQYDGKKPGATVTALEDFILTDMDKISPETSCISAPAPGDPNDQNLDYFLQLRAKLRNAILDRCHSLSSEGVLKTYSEISDMFNAKLAGQFPFGPIPRDKNGAEASPEAIVEFYNLLDRNGTLARTTLRENSRFGEAGQLALQFLDQVEALRPFVLFAGDNAKEPPFTADVTPHFRVNQASESGANEIIEWTMQIGGQIFHQGEPDHAARWHPGSPIRLSLRWATDSIYQPIGDGQPNLRIRARSAFFEYLNRWSLLAFILRQQAVPSDLGQGADFRPYTLKFRLRTVRDPKWTTSDAEAPGTPAIAFMHANIALPGTKTAGLLPVFPVKAPRLDVPAGRQ